MEIQPLCRYHFRNSKAPEKEFLIIDLLPHPNSTYNRYRIEYVGAAKEDVASWYYPWLIRFKDSIEGTFSEIKKQLEAFIVEAFKYNYRCEMTYLTGYFK